MGPKALLYVLLSLAAVTASPLMNCPMKYLTDPAVTSFRRYVQIDTSKEHNLQRAVAFWRSQAQELGLPFHVFYPAGLPVCVISWLGSDPSLPSIMLNSHMDVVPAVEEEWKYPPFSAFIDESGDIYGRGTQDDKDVSIQYIEAVRRLKRGNITLNRTLHLTFMPDEETGGFKGMKAFIKTEAFKAMNVGFALDEGLVSPDDTLLVTDQDRRPWQLQVTVRGEGGHGFSMPDQSAMEKATHFINAVNAYRDKLRVQMKSAKPLDFESWSSVNINILTAGYRPNIIPTEVVLVADMRLSSASNVTEVEQVVKSWLAAAGNGTELVYIRRDDVSEKTKLDGNPYWEAMRGAMVDISTMGPKALLYVLLSLAAVTASPLMNCPMKYLTDPAVTSFRRYVQIDTSKEHNLQRAVAFWRSQAQELGLPFHVFYPAGLPVCVISWLGSDPSLPSIMLNSHMDVVPAVEEEWKYPPFSAFIDESGDIYGRGTQDDKDVSIQYIEAVRRLKRGNITLNRTLHLTFMPDEETGGFKGMKAFIKTEAFKAMNVGFALDEGLVSPDDTLLVTDQDRRPWQLQVTVRGEGGHGFSMPDQSAMEKATHFINAVNAYRDKLRVQMKSAKPLDFESWSSVNINILTAGYRPNIIPTEVVLVADMRLSSASNVTEVEQVVKSWLAAAGNGTELVYIRRDDVSEKTKLDGNPYWEAMRGAMVDMGIKVVPVVCPATTDMLVLRALGIPALGFSPKFRTNARPHMKDEYLNAETFLKGIDVFYNILKRIGNVELFESTP